MFGLFELVGVDAREVGGVDHGFFVNHCMNIPPFVGDGEIDLLKCLGDVFNDFLFSPPFEELADRCHWYLNASNCCSTSRVAVK